MEENERYYESAPSERLISVIEFLTQQIPMHSETLAMLKELNEEVA